MERKIYAENRRATFDYEILERFEAGLALLGSEVKSIQAGKVTIAGGFVIFRGDIPYLVGCDIPAYQPINMPGAYDPERARALLLHKKEVVHLQSEVHEKKLTIVPIKVYNKGSRIKVELGLGKHKNSRDKREALKKKEDRRQAKAAVGRSPKDAW
jgi:SsrA-binding protein